MQKQVSKQSLAIVALSILLAIAMALTATFAAFQDSKTASGTVTFSGNVITTIQLGADPTLISLGAFSEGSATLTIAGIGNAANGNTLASELGAIKVGLDDASTAAKYALKVTISGDAAAALTATAKGEVEGWTISNGVWSSTNTIAAGSTGMVTLSTFYTFAFVEAGIPSSAASANATITIQVAASTGTPSIA